MFKPKKPRLHLEIQTHRKNPIGVIRSTFRNDGKVVHETHGRITGMGLPQLKLIQAAFRNEVVPVGSADALQTVGSKEFGGAAALLKLVRDLGLDKVLYSRKEPWVGLVLAMVTGRLLYQGSKLSLVNRWKDTALWELAGIDGRPDVEKHCYESMDRLLDSQARVQKKLAAKHMAGGEVVLYDITSSYLEGEYEESELADYGYSRDGKKSRKQIVIGLACNREGCPVAVEVFSGDTKDESTVMDKIRQLQQDLGLERIIFVGDRGMVTASNYEKIRGVGGVDTITALTHREILGLLETKDVQLELFDQRQPVEVEDPRHPGRRLVLCLNPDSAAKETATRQALMDKTREALERIAHGCTLRSTSDKTIGERLGRVFEKYGMGKFVETWTEDIQVGKQQKPGKIMRWGFKQEKIDLEQATDGCYVIASDVPGETMGAEETVATYKSLGQVEQAFRNLKTASLELRPIYHKTDDRIRAHAFLCMLAYYLQWHLEQRLAPLFEGDGEYKQRRWSLEMALERLMSIRRKKVVLNGVEFDHVDTPDPEQQQILDLLGVTL